MKSKSTKVSTQRTRRLSNADGGRKLTDREKLRSLCRADALTALKMSFLSPEEEDEFGDDDRYYVSKMAESVIDIGKLHGFCTEPSENFSGLSLFEKQLWDYALKHAEESDLCFRWSKGWWL
jgi:hypothetical protein